MSVYVDQLRETPRSGQWPFREGCHLYADTREQLFAFADLLGLKRAWFQDHSKLPHFDLAPYRRERAVRLGAIEVTLHDVGVKMQDPEYIREWALASEKERSA